MKKFKREDLRETFERQMYKFAAAHTLDLATKSFSVPIDGPADLASWIGVVMLASITHNTVGTSIYISDEKGITHLTISSGSIQVHAEDYAEVVGEDGLYRNCFGIVTCPLYPEPFGRYSNDVCVVMSRMKDFTNMSSVDRRKVRRACNMVYRDHGVVITDLEEDKQPEGLWIPQYSI